MAYNQFTLPRVVADFGLVLNTAPDLFPGVPPYSVPGPARANLAQNYQLATAVNTEAARAQLLIGPLLTEVWRVCGYRVALFVGTRFDVDDVAGLTGVCDYILGRPPQLNYVTAPVMMIVEAKNEDIPGGLGQCAAAMIAAQRFNAGRNPDIQTVYGAVTDGGAWQLLRLRGAALDLAFAENLMADPDRLFGILLHIVGVTPAAPAAA